MTHGEIVKGIQQYILDSDLQSERELQNLVEAILDACASDETLDPIDQRAGWWVAADILKILERRYRYGV